MPSFFRMLAYSGAALALTVTVGCSSGDSVDPQLTDEVSEAPAETTPAPAAASNERIRLRANGGEDVLILQVQGDDATIEAESGAASFALTTAPDQSVQVNDAAGASLAVVTVGDGQWVVSHASQPEESYILSRSSDGNYQFETADGDAIYRIQKRAYGFEVTAPDETSLYKVRVKGERLVLRSAENQTVMVTRDTLVPAAMLPFAFDVLSPEQQFGLAYALHQAGG